MQGASGEPPGRTEGEHGGRGDREKGRRPIARLDAPTDLTLDADRTIACGSSRFLLPTLFPLTLPPFGR